MRLKRVARALILKKLTTLVPGKVSKSEVKTLAMLGRGGSRSSSIRSFALVYLTGPPLECARAVFVFFFFCLWNRLFLKGTSGQSTMQGWTLRERHRAAEVRSCSETFSLGLGKNAVDPDRVDKVSQRAWETFFLSGRLIPSLSEARGDALGSVF